MNGQRSLPKHQLHVPSALPSTVMPRQQGLAPKTTREQLNRAPDGDGLSCPGTLNPPHSQELQVLPSHCRHHGHTAGNSQPWPCATLMAPDQHGRREKEPGQLLGKSQEWLQEGAERWWIDGRREQGARGCSPAQHMDQTSRQEPRGAISRGRLQGDLHSSQPSTRS